MKNDKLKFKNKAQSILTFTLSFFILIFAFSIIPAGNVSATVMLEALSDTTPKGDFVVGPAKVEMSLDPGQKKTVTLTITNRLGADKIFTITEEDVRGSDNPEQSVVLLGDDRGPYSLKDYISSESTSILIPSGHRARVGVTVSIPANAEPGGLYGSLIIGTASNVANTDTSGGAAATNALVTRIGTLFFVRVNGAVNENGRLEKFDLAGGKRFVFDENDLRFNLVFKNVGNVSLNPYGTININNIIGATVGTIQVDPWYALPESLRFREVVWQPKFIFGRYTAWAEISPGYGTNKDRLSFSFWYIPWKVITVVLLGLLVLITIIKWVITRFQKLRNGKIKNQNEK